MTAESRASVLGKACASATLAADAPAQAGCETVHAQLLSSLSE